MQGFLGHCWILRDLLQLPLHYCHTSTYDQTLLPGEAGLYLMSFISISLMPTLNGIYLHFSVKRVSLIGLHLVTLHKSLTHFFSVILWQKVCQSILFCGIVWHSMALLSGTLPGERRRPGWQEQQAVAARPTGLQEWTHQDPQWTHPQATVHAKTFSHNLKQLKLRQKGMKQTDL